MTYPDATLRRVLRRTKCIACVGLSANPVRPSYFVGRYLHQRGYRVIPVNPAYAGQSFFGENFVAGLGDIATGTRIDMVDIFRRSAEVPPIVTQALRLFADLSCIWMQIGVEHAAAAAQAEARGVTVIQNRCPKLEYQRLFGELRKAGVNTGVISSKLP